MVGGDATHAGTAFQNEVAAYVATKILLQRPWLSLDLGDVTLTSVHQETTAPIDDILVATSNNGYVFINVKTAVQISDSPKSPFASVIDQFVRQWLTCKGGQKLRSWDRPLDELKDRFVLVVGTERSETLVSAAKTVIDRARNTPPNSAGWDLSTNEDQRSFVNAFRRHFDHSWEQLTGSQPSYENFAAVLRLTNVLRLDFIGKDRDEAISSLADAVLSPNSQSSGLAWDALLAVTSAFAIKRTGGDRLFLREKLREKGLKLRPANEYASDIAQLQSITQRTLNYLSPLASLSAPTAEGIKKVVIERDCAKSITENSQNSSFLLVGSPGAGKSGALHSAAAKLAEDGRAVVVLAVDQYPVSTLEQLRKELLLEHDFLEVLRAWSPEAKGVLFVDALDATRGGPSDGVFHALLSAILDSAPTWSVVASIRSFDLQFGAIYRDLFAGAPPDQKFADKRFARVRHLQIQPLTDSELLFVWQKSPEMHAAYSEASPKLKELLHSPFNLFLLSKILPGIGVSSDLAKVDTQTGLLDRYWSHRVIGNDHDGLGREDFLHDCLDTMLQNHQLFIERRAVSTGATTHLQKLLASGILSSGADTDNIRRISFAHHMLFDYAVARLTLGSGKDDDLPATLTQSNDTALLLAPAAVLAFQMLWQEHNDRRAFFDVAIKVAQASGVGSFCRMLPARIIAELTSAPEDFAPLLEALKSSNKETVEAAQFLVRHAFGALRTSVIVDDLATGPRSGAWLKIARRLVEDVVDLIAYSLKPVTAYWSSHVPSLKSSQVEDLNVVGRSLIDFALRQTSPDRGTVVVGIQTTARTLFADPKASKASIRQLLTPAMIQNQGHEYLSWLARESEPLRFHAPDILYEVYVAAFCTPLPSADEKTQMGNSRILTLTSNKRQDFQGARYALGEQFLKFAAQDISHGVAVVNEAVRFEANGDRKRRRRKDAESTSFKYEQQKIVIEADYSRFRMEPQKGEPSYLLQQLGIALGQSLASGDEAALQKSLAALMKKPAAASLWAKLFRVCADHAELTQAAMLPLLLLPQLIGHDDIALSAAAFIGKLHPLLSNTDRESVERSILEVPTEYQRATLLRPIPLSSLISPSARAELERTIEEDRVNQKARTGAEWPGRDDNWWLKSEGVDLNIPANAELNKKIEAIEELKTSNEENDRARDRLGAHWSQVQQLERDLLLATTTPTALLNKGWDALCEFVDRAAIACQSPEHLQAFPGALELIKSALEGAPLQPLDEEAEQSFAKSPSWGRPAPRVPAAAALMAIGRALKRPNKELQGLIIKLAKDPDPVIRNQILSRLNLISEADPEFMWGVAQRVLAEETNPSNLTFLLSALRPVMHMRPAWLADQSEVLFHRLPSLLHVDDASESLHNVLVPFVLRLWLIHDQEPAAKRVVIWLNDPVKNHLIIDRATTNLRESLAQGDPDKPNELNERVRSRAIELFTIAATKAVAAFRALNHRAELSKEEFESAQNALALVDNIATQVYFASGAYRESQSSDQQKTRDAERAVRARFWKETHELLSTLALAAYPSVTHHLLETLEHFVADDPRGVFQLIAKAVIEGRSGGYQFEDLGLKLLIKLIRQYLADYRWIFIDSEEARIGLMSALDTFVDAGWPDAQELAYTLPEMLR